MRVLFEENVKVVCFSDLISPSRSVCAMCERSEDCTIYEANNGDRIQGVRLSEEEQ